MKAAVYHKPFDVTFEDIADPVCGPDDILVKNAFAGICGTDVTAWTYNGDIVAIFDGNEFGHEFVGVVEEVGANVSEFKVGDRVWVNPCTCKRQGLFRADTAGAFSEKVLVEDAKLNYNAYMIPENVSLEEAVVIEPFCVGTHGKNAPGTQVGDNVVIYGDGPIGLCALSGLVGQGVEKVAVVGHRANRLALVEEMGGHAINSHDADYKEQIKAFFGTVISPYGQEVPDVQVWIDCAGSKSVVDDILSMINSKARVSFVAVHKAPYELDLAAVMTNEWHIVGAAGYTHEDITEVLGHLANKSTKIGKIVTHHFKHEQIVEALECSASKESGSIKVVIDY